jgi:hypothetical protein
LVSPIRDKTKTESTSLMLIIKTILARLLALLLMCAALLTAAAPASANVSAIVLHRRTCSVVSAYAVYDGFSGGSAPFYAVFAADLNSDGVFGGSGEPKVFIKLNTALRQASLVNTRLRFSVPEGTVVAVTAYEQDSNGALVSGQLSPVSYACTNRPAYDPLPPNTGIAIRGVGVTAKVQVDLLKVYSEANAESTVIGGLIVGAEVNVKAINSRGDWVQVDLGGGNLGWIMWQTQAYLFGPYKQLPVIG